MNLNGHQHNIMLLEIRMTISFYSKCSCWESKSNIVGETWVAQSMMVSFLNYLFTNHILLILFLLILFLLNLILINIMLFSFSFNFLCQSRGRGQCPLLLLRLLSPLLLLLLLLSNKINRGWGKKTIFVTLWFLRPPAPTNLHEVSFVTPPLGRGTLDWVYVKTSLPTGYVRVPSNSFKGAWRMGS